MKINLSNALFGNVNVKQEAPDASHVSRLASSPAAAGFTVTRAFVSPEDVEAAAIPAAALSRGDSLGALIGRVFCLPPPLMPSFANF